MSAAEASIGNEQSKNTSLSVLPPNVFIFSPVDLRAAESLLNSQIFTRLAVSAQTEPTKLSEALSSVTLSERFLLSHRNAILLFDDSGDEGLEDHKMDSHHENFRLVALALMEFDISLDVAGCVFDAPDVLQAGFQLDRLSNGAVMVIDLVNVEDEDGDDDDLSDDDSSDKESLLSKEREEEEESRELEF